MILGYIEGTPVAKTGDLMHEASMQLSNVLRSLPVLCFAIAMHGQATDPKPDQQPRRLQLDDFSTIVHVADPQISPDGKSIVCVVGRPNLKDDRFDSSLALIDIASGAQRPLTHERRNVASPRWSPSGDRIAFLAQAPTAATPRR